MCSPLQNFLGAKVLGSTFGGKNSYLDPKSQNHKKEEAFCTFLYNLLPFVFPTIMPYANITYRKESHEK